MMVTKSKSILLYYCDQDGDHGSLYTTFQYETTRYPNREAAERNAIWHFVRATVQGFDLDVNKRLALYCSEGAEELDRTPKKAGLSGPFIIVARDKWGNLTSLSYDACRIAARWVRSRDFGKEIREIKAESDDNIPEMDPVDIPLAEETPEDIE